MKKVLFTISLTLNLLCLIGIILLATKWRNLPDELNWEESVTLTEENLNQTYIQLADNLLMLKECSKSELRSKIEARCNAKGFTLKDIDFSDDRYPSETYEEEILNNPPANLTSNEYKNYLETVIHRYGLRYTNGNIELNIEIYDGWENKDKERVSKISLRNLKISSFDVLKKEIKAAKYRIGGTDKDFKTGCPIATAWKDRPMVLWGVGDVLTYGLDMYYFYEKDGNIHLNYDLDIVGRGWGGM